MDWLTQLNDALRYIEDHLDQKIDINCAAQIACCSGFHFQRLFSYMAGVPLSEYIRRRRMTMAAFDLQNSDDKIIDVALRYGYDSPTSFNRAFQSVHGAPPSAARNEGVVLKAYHPISFKITIRGEAEMNYHIETKESFRILGYKTRILNAEDSTGGFEKIPGFWQEIQKKGAIPGLCQLMDGMPKGILGVCTGDWQNATIFDYYIAVSSTQPVSGDLVEYQVPAGTWAVFECKGPIPGAVQTMQKRIMTEWLPGSGYQYADAPDIEIYPEGNQSSQDYTCWIWMPVKK